MEPQSSSFSPQMPRVDAMLSPLKSLHIINTTPFLHFHSTYVLVSWCPLSITTSTLISIIYATCVVRNVKPD
jgi:hypothetical protein